MKLEEKIGRLQLLIDRAPSRRGDGELAPWRNEAMTTLRLFLGDGNDTYKRFAALRFSYQPKDGCRSTVRGEQVFSSSITGARGLLVAAIGELELEAELGTTSHREIKQDNDNVGDISYPGAVMEPDPKHVLAIHGHNDAARREMFDGGWEVAHAEERTYILSNRLDCDAKNVKIAPLTRTTGKPGAQPGSTEKVQVRDENVVSAGTGLVIDLPQGWQDAPLPFRLQIDWDDEYGEQFRAMPEVPRPDRRPRPRPDLRSPVPPGFATAAGRLATRSSSPRRSVGPRPYADSVSGVNPKKVFVVVGRNTAASDSMFSFLRAIGLDPIEWSEAVGLTGSGSPYIGQALDAAFEIAQAFVVLMTPDDQAHLLPEYANGDDDPDLEPKGQARPNVLFEAGMALGRHPDRTILVELGPLRPFSDVAGRHTVRLDNSAAKRNELANRLRNAGCDVNTTGSGWLGAGAGDFTPPKVPSSPRGRRLPSVGPTKAMNRLDARYLRRTSGSDRITVQNIGPEEVFDLTSPNAKDFHGRIDGFPIRRLPVGKSATLIAMAAMGVPDTWDLIVTGRTDSGEEFTEPLFLDLNA